MKKPHGVIAIITALTFLTAGPALAGEGADVDTEADGCTVGALVFAFGMVPTLAQVEADGGQGVATPDGSGKLTCHGRIDHGADTIAVVAFLPGPTPNVPVTIMTHEEMCFWLPLLVPGQGCNGKEGSIIVHGDDLGIECRDRYIDNDGNVVVRSTFDWTEVLSPSGQATTICHFD
jgi:hypothetical protein